MVSSFSVSEILQSYPEQNPFELDPPPPFLTPPSPLQEYDTPEFRDAARDVTLKSLQNPLYLSYGLCPLTVRDPDLRTADHPLSSYVVPPPLPRATISGPIVFLQQINLEGRNPIFKVRVEREVRLLKIVSPWSSLFRTLTDSLWQSTTVSR